jgi:hypothetical protein
MIYFVGGNSVKKEKELFICYSNRRIWYYKFGVPPIHGKKNVTHP